jgi:hypothetical protein
MVATVPANALCIGCNYPLRGLTEPRCPECGRPFDLVDRETFNSAVRSPHSIASCFVRLACRRLRSSSFCVA